ncbi:MAG: DUF2628 domain-containing protein [Oscillospiraceae bacterium]|jgi:hypothetical protein|nr:DUF2628 domain-containing protein [Oscillospiraceae bacterium]
MNDFVGKTCPYCNNELQETDEVVLCGSCGRPHHKACWAENGGCTTFGCDGSVSQNGAAASPAGLEAESPPQAGTFCTSCGARQEASTRFCGNCGACIDPPQAHAQNAGQNTSGGQAYYAPPYGQSNDSYAPNFNPFNAALDPEVEQYIGEKQEYYMDKFRKMKEQNKNASWNWCAFLFSTFWFIYRKMYLYALALFAVGILLSAFDLIANIAISLVCGILGNYLYMGHLEKLAKEGKQLPEPLKEDFVASKKGVNVVAVGLIILAYLVLISINFAVRGFVGI